ncbi:F-box protein CPR30-like [Chenopodium quinoa]|uniref:F-box protein CPR30-like n=1 Tax=Chenopodium quinoa TaxID=63459 RepID=UPI000B76ECE7|nr:F-box protein CPR30-like [Chenopodium quinoa]
MSSIYLDIIIFNPSTGIYKRIEVTDLAFHGTSSIPISEDRHFTNFGFGFGFDHVNDDYKVVKVTSNHFDDLRVVDSKVMVYSLKTNSWRRAQNFPRSLNRYMDSLMEAAVIDNHLLHWLIYSPLGQLEIACFDICNETWREDIACPNSLVPRSCSNPELGVLDGCLYFFYEILSTSKFDVWVMKEYGVKESWVKLFEIDFRVFVNNICHRTWRLREASWVMIDVIPTSTTAANSMTYVIPSSTMGYVCNGSLVNIPGGRPLRVNKEFRLTTFKEVFRLASRKRTKGRTNNALAKQQQQQRDFNLQGQGKRLMNNKWTR